MENISLNFGNEIQIMEAKCFYGFQMMMENIHAETYSLMIDTFIEDIDKKQRLFDSLNSIACVKSKASWAFKWMDQKTKSFEQRLVAFACVEGIFFSGSFCAIFWLKKRGLMPGLTFSNELISRDEALHTEFACLLYNKYCVQKLPTSILHTIIKEAVDIECKFVCEALPVNLIGMNSNLMRQYIKFVADQLCLILSNTKIYNVTNPFLFMNMISLRGKTNFFEKRVSEYARTKVISKQKIDNVFDLDADF
jgi:ribonucleoside-diphosphate reductase beta chain